MHKTAKRIKVILDRPQSIPSSIVDQIVSQIRQIKKRKTRSISNFPRSTLQTHNFLRKQREEYQVRMSRPNVLQIQNRIERNGRLIHILIQEKASDSRGPWHFWANSTKSIQGIGARRRDLLVKTRRRNKHVGFIGEEILPRSGKIWGWNCKPAAWGGSNGDAASGTRRRGPRAGDAAYGFRRTGLRLGLRRRGLRLGLQREAKRWAKQMRSWRGGEEENNNKVTMRIRIVEIMRVGWPFSFLCLANEGRMVVVPVL